HIGRDADIVGLDAETFDHGLTDFALEGAHAAVACDGCHEAGKKFREAPGACVDCHKEDEPHKGRLGRECETCHKPVAWTDLRPFDHSKTRFALKDGHQKVACQACHVAETYKELPLTCVGCHRIQDVHQASVGPKCETCHSPAGWTKVSFDHAKDTKFPLRGKHAKAACQACHSPTDAKGEPKPDCVSCHKKDDPHKGKLGERCDSCHAEEGWREGVAFDHDITKFPLIGLHVLVPCEACHIDETYRGTPVDCVECHRQDDTHKGTLGPKCETCHNPNDWALWSFDHDTQTKFKLTGQHKGLVCRACHVEGMKNPLKPPTACIGCHRRDDVHKGRFGTNCGACHATDTFKGARLR
ncbi:MAG: cytochrome C, partial [Alphaproteobacteria bacterium]